MKRRLHTLDPRLLLVLGTLLVLVFPMSIALMGNRPDLMSDRPRSIPTIGWFTLLLWIGPGLFIAAVISWLGVLLLVRTIFPQGRTLWLTVMLVCGLLLCCSGSYITLDTSFDDLQIVQSIGIQHRRYYLFQAHYPSGPTLQALYACNVLGWACTLVEAHPRDLLTASDVEGYLRSLPTLP